MGKGGKVKKKFRPLLVLMDASSPISGLYRVEHRILKSASFVGVLTFLPGYFPVFVEVGTCCGKPMPTDTE